jgi:hypothetical protein
MILSQQVSRRSLHFWRVVELLVAVVDNVLNELHRSFWKLNRVFILRWRTNQRWLAILNVLGLSVASYIFDI